MIIILGLIFVFIVLALLKAAAFITISKGIYLIMCGVALAITVVPLIQHAIKDYKRKHQQHVMLVTEKKENSE